MCLSAQSVPIAIIEWRDEAREERWVCLSAQSVPIAIIEWRDEAREERWVCLSAQSVPIYSYNRVARRGPGGKVGVSVSPECTYSYNYTYLCCSCSCQFCVLYFRKVNWEETLRICIHARWL